MGAPFESPLGDLANGWQPKAGDDLGVPKRIVAQRIGSFPRIFGSPQVCLRFIGWNEPVRNRPRPLELNCMINITTERVLSLTEGTRLLPRRRRGRKPCPSTLYRWAKRGLRGVRLETVRVGGTLCTSVEALHRFFEELGRASPGDGNVPQTSQPSDHDVETQLDELGL